MSFRFHRGWTPPPPAITVANVAHAVVRRADRERRRAFQRRVWERSRISIAVVLVVTSAAIWAAKWHETRVALLERENVALHALLHADRNQITVVATGCGREELINNLSAAAADIDDFRWKLRHAAQE